MFTHCSILERSRHFVRQLVSCAFCKADFAKTTSAISFSKQSVSAGVPPSHAPMTQLQLDALQIHLFEQTSRVDFGTPDFEKWRIEHADKHSTVELPKVAKIAEYTSKKPLALKLNIVTSDGPQSLTFGGLHVTLLDMINAVSKVGGLSQVGGSGHCVSMHYGIVDLYSCRHVLHVATCQHAPAVICCGAPQLTLKMHLPPTS
jgi:hypothetical protein